MQGLAILAFKKKFQTHPPKPAKVKPIFSKGQPTPCKSTYVFPHSPLG